MFKPTQRHTKEVTASMSTSSDVRDCNMPPHEMQVCLHLLERFHFTLSQETCKVATSQGMETDECFSDTRFFCYSDWQQIEIEQCTFGCCQIQSPWWWWSLLVYRKAQEEWWGRPYQKIAPVTAPEEKLFVWKAMSVSASLCWHLRCIVCSTCNWSLFLIRMHIPQCEIYRVFHPRTGPYLGFFHSSMTNREHYSLNYPILV